MINDVNRAVALRISELLKEKKMTQYRLAMNSGVTHSTLKNIMHETVKDNLLSTIILLAAGFDMTVSEFLNSPLFLEENLNIWWGFDMKLKDAVAKRIKEIIKEKGITQYELFKMTGVPQSTISTILKNETKTVKFSTIYEICSGLEIEFLDFFNCEYLKLENITD